MVDIKKIRYCFLCLLFTLMIINVAQSQVSLAGQWGFKLDPQDQGLSNDWFSNPLNDTFIELPGSCEQRGFGIKNTFRDSSRLTRVIKYEGKAWYQRSINVPLAWQRKRIELLLERCHWVSSVWLDGKPYGTQNSLSAPHVYDFGIIASGNHTVTICIDNTYGKLPIGPWGFAITDDTQGNWNGMIGRLELSATDPVWIMNTQVFGNHLQVKVGNITGMPQTAVVQQKSFRIPIGGANVDIPFKAKLPYWDEFAPSLKTLPVILKAGKYQDTKNVVYGYRQWSTSKGQFILNGRPVMVRGPVNECVYPLTGYPPMDKSSWLHLLEICKSYGFNFMRFNSWCPPDAAFQAADELGMFLQVELPFWSMFAPLFGQHPERDQFLADELQLILQNYGNHPSFAFMAMGNESPGPLDLLVNKGRQTDTRMLYRCQNGDTILNGDYAERGTEIGQRGVLGPVTDWDRWSMLTGTDAENYRRSALPVIGHEVGQWSSYPNFSQLSKFTGTLKPYNYERFQHSLATHNMAAQNKAFADASGKFAVSLYKDEIEGSLRTWPYGGFQVVEARDFPGEGTAIIGWLDAFWDSKGLITPEAFRKFCAPMVCLLRMPKRIYTNAEVFTAKAGISNYGPAGIRTMPTWKIEDEKGRIIAAGSFPERTIKTGWYDAVGTINASLESVRTASKLTVTLTGAGTSNSWNIWVYPTKQTPAPQQVKVVYRFDANCLRLLGKGENVLLFSSPKQGVNKIEAAFLPADSIRLFPIVSKDKSAIPGSYLPAFWSLQLFNQIGTLGILCDPQHPALATFPTASHSDWQWADILGNYTAQLSYKIAMDDQEHNWGDHSERSKAIILNETPPDYRPIVQVIDNYERNYKLGVIFETRVGKGRLLICAMDLDTDAENRPAARQLKTSLLNYAGSKQFDPAYELSMNLLERILNFQ